MDFDFSTLITDRAPSDLELLRDLLSTPISDWTAEQLAAFNQAASKGAYNYTDLNRVTACMDYLNERLTALGYVTGYQRVVVPHKGGGGLPEGYAKLEYIESTGMQYIDTGFKPNQDTRVVCSTQFAKQNAAAWLFGARNGNYDSSFGFLTYQNNYRSDYDTNSVQTIIGSYEGFFFVDKDKNVTSINDEIESTASATTFQCSYNLYLFANNNGGAVAGQSDAKISSCQIYDNGTLIRDYVPCTNSDGTAGLYDIENGQFYGNAGAGSFIAGPEVTPDPGGILDPYTWYEMDIPTYPQMQRYITNGKVLRETLALPESTAAMPEDMVGLTQEEANAIEGVLGIIEGWIHNMAAAWFYSGDLYAGEV